MTLDLTIMFFLVFFPQDIEKCSLDRVSHAVAVYETSSCTKGVGRLNNCHGLRYKGEWLKFDSPEESHEYFKRLWIRRYSGGCPTLADAMKYDSKENAHNWLANVNKSL